MDEPGSQATPEREAPPPEDNKIQSRTPGVAHEAALHLRELVHFGRCLRDRLSLWLPDEAAGPFAGGDALAMWGGRTGLEAPRGVAEENVESEWRFGRYDASRHSFFAALKQHLAGHPCWGALEAVESGFREYRDACQRAHTAVLEGVREGLPDLAEWDAKAMANSLLVDAYYRVVGLSGGSEFSYDPKRAQDNAGVRWHLQLGAWGVGYAEDPAMLKPLALVHSQLAAAMPFRAELRALGEAGRAARRAIGEFQQLLSPDARLRKLVLNGHCDLCL